MNNYQSLLKQQSNYFKGLVMAFSLLFLDSVLMYQYFNMDNFKIFLQWNITFMVIESFWLLLFTLILLIAFITSVLTKSYDDAGNFLVGTIGIGALLVFVISSWPQPLWQFLIMGLLIFFWLALLGIIWGMVTKMIGMR